MSFPQLTVQDYGRGAYLVTTAEKPIPLKSVAYVGDELTQILNADDGETARRFAYLFAAAPELLAALVDVMGWFDSSPFRHLMTKQGYQAECCRIINEARAAIAAAEGKAVES